MSRRVIIATTVAATAVAGLAPAFASPAKPKAKPQHGTWSFTDTTPDPTVEAFENLPSGGAPIGDCSAGKLPAAPTDVNEHDITVTGPGTLTVAGHNQLDWAMEIRDKAGNVLTGSDGTSPRSAEGASMMLKPGTYSVVYCNLEGEPTITASYTFRFS